VTTLSGVGVSAGIVVGPVARLGARCSEPPAHPAPTDPAGECGRLAQALAAVGEDLQRRADAAVGGIGEIIAATAMMAQDSSLRTQSETLVVQQRLPAARAVWLVADQYAQTLAAAGGYLAERVADLFDVRDRVVARLTGAGLPGLPEPGHPYVLVARDLSPADTAMLDLDQVLALVTEEGGPTGHTAIIARSLGLPAVVAWAQATQLRDGQLVAVDGGTGSVETDADPAQAPSAPRRRRTIRLPDGPVTTADGQAVRLLANVGDGAAARRAADLGVPGSGLFRSELLFLDRTEAPGIEEQRAAYAEVLRAFPAGRVVARTLDAGADKPLPFLQMADEPNPALGVRGLRVAADDEQVLVDQLTALAAARDETGTDTWVMAPMVATLAEARWFREHCTRAGLPHVGVMVEVPSAALLADELLEVVDFLSIGTNDLAQYTMAADRMSGRLAALNDPWQPAVLRLVRLVAAAGVRADKPIGVCGEAAADPLLACVLVGLGIGSLSADAGALPAVAVRLAGVTREQCAQAALAACATGSPQDARTAAEQHLGAQHLPTQDPVGVP
jgi:phosphotransferase system enzyme I (PtsI)